MNESRKIKVLIVAPSSPMVGGQAVQAARLVEKFRSEKDLEVNLQPVNPQFFPAFQKIKYVRTVLTSAKYLFDLLVKIPRYDVIHVFSASYFSFLLAPVPALFIAKLFGKKTILNYRSGEAEDHLTRWKSAKFFIKCFDRIIVPSGYLVDVFAKFDLKAETIFNFVDTSKYKYRERKPLEPNFLSNRNFEKLYNVECVLKAFAEIQKTFPEAKLTVAGDGTERENLYQTAKDLNVKNVEFVGRISPDEMPKLYDASDVYLNAPNIDNMPNSIIEAFAAGTAVVSTDAGGIPYICKSGETALLVKVGDAENLARQATFLLENDGEAQKIISAAKEEVSKYSWENVRGKWIDLYRALAK